MLKRYLLIMLTFMAAVKVSAQTGKVWTLDECIRYAEENSIDVMSQSLTTDKNRLTLQEGKWAFVPSLSFSSGYTASTGRVLDPTTYQFVETELTGNSSSSISGDIAIFEGGRKIHELDKAKLSLRAAYLQEETVKFNLRLNVIAAYMDVLCAHEQVGIAEQAAFLIEAQLERSKILLNAGNITESDVLQLNSQLFSAKNDVSAAIQSEQMAKLSLCDLLEIDDYPTFTVAEPEIADAFTDSIDIEAAIDNNPEYRYSLLGKEIAFQDLKIAQASLYPSLSLSTGYGTSWSDARQKSVVNTDGTLKYEAYPFLRQYADNASAYVSVGLKIPILTGLSGRNAVNRARIAVKEADYSALTAEKQLRKKIIQAQIDSDAAMDRYRRASEKAHYAAEAQRQIGEKYNLGTTDFLTWSTAVVEVTKAMYSLAEAKYSSLLKSEILRNYYMYR